MERIFSAIPFYYAVTEAAPNSVCLCVQMQDAVSGEILKNAVERAMERYPYFCVKVLRQAEEFVLEENREPVVVYQGGEKIALGSREANLHLLTFSWEDDKIKLDFFHGLADGGGIYPLICTVLYYYCKEKYDSDLSSEGIRLCGEPIPAEEIEEPYPKSVSPQIKARGKAGRKTALNLASQGLCTPGTPTEYKIRIPKEAFMKYSRQQDGSPAAVIALLCAHAIDEIHKETDLPIICGMAMNTRGVLGKPLAHHSLVSQLFLEYKLPMKKMSMQDQATCIRGMIMVQGQDENIMDSVRNNIKLFNMTASLPDIESKKKMMRDVVSRFLDVDTFKVSYMGRSGFGAAEKYIRSIDTVVDLNGSGIMLEVAALNNMFYISFLQEWPEDIYVRAFIEQLEKEKIPYEYAGSSPATLARVILP